MPIDYNNNDELKATIASTSSIGIDPLGPYTTHYYGPPPQKTDAIQDLIERQENKRDIEEIKNITQLHDIRICQQDREIYDIREKVKEALAVLHHPGLIANRVLDKVDSFITKYKKVLTDKQGVTTEMVEVSKLNEMVKQLREVIKNGNNDEGL